MYTCMLHTLQTVVCVGVSVNNIIINDDDIYITLYVSGH